MSYIIKKNILIVLMMCGVTVANAWINADMEAIVCNNTLNDMRFEKTYGYQADTRDDSSTKFELPSGSCHAINFWVQWQASGFDEDDTLTFTEKSIPTKGKFNLKVLQVGAPPIRRVGVVEFHMDDYFNSNIIGLWTYGCQTEVVLIINGK